MIVHFKSKGAEDLYHGIDSKDARKIPQEIWSTALRKLDMLNTAAELRDLKAPPGNHLEALRGRFKGKWSIRINDQFRLVFVFQDGNADQVEILDYH